MAERKLQYKVTNTAPPYVLGQRVNHGDTMNLTEREARISVALQWLILLGAIPPVVIPPIDPVGVAQWKDLDGSRALTMADLGVGLRHIGSDARIVTLPRDLPVGFWNPGKQWSSGKVTFVAASGATKKVLDGGDRTRGEGASWFVQVVRNVDGQSAEWDVTGDLEEA